MLGAGLLAGCAAGPKPQATRDLIDEQMTQATEVKVPPAPLSRQEVNQALLPPMPAGIGSGALPAEQRFDLSVNGAPAGQVFLAIASGTPYSVIVPPEMSGTISVNLKNVTLREALDTIRDTYGYDYRVQGTRIFIQSLSLQTRIFHVNYLTSRRSGSSGTRVSSGASSNTATGGSAASAAGSETGNGTRVSTDNDSDFWREVRNTIRIMIGCVDKPGTDGAVTYGDCPEGRSVVTSLQSGIVVVRGMPGELREVEDYLRLARIATERQVMIEAKIIEVVLNEGFQSGINWATFNKSGGHRFSSNANTDAFNFPGGRPGISAATDATNAAIARGNSLSAADAAAQNAFSAANAAAANAASAADAAAATAFNLANAVPGTAPTYVSPTFTAPTYTSATYDTTVATAANTLTGAAGVLAPLGGLLSGGVIGLAFQTGSFSALLSFLETQGAVHVLSSPRIATINNQKAVLKVGTDDIFVSNFTPGTAATATTAGTPPVPTLTPYFSGISLDVTPQIDRDGHIMLHVRPMVSVVTERTKIINFGTQGSFTVPLASSSVNETDSIVRVTNGNIVAIGGLMEQAQSDDAAKVPGVGDIPAVGELFKQGKKSLKKREFVVLLRPTIIDSDQQWANDLNQTRDRLRGMNAPRPAEAR
jgi:MSHA biogenesis protein MshL